MASVVLKRTGHEVGEILRVFIGIKSPTTFASDAACGVRNDGELDELI